MATVVTDKQKLEIFNFIFEQEFRKCDHDSCDNTCNFCQLRKLLKHTDFERTFKNVEVLRATLLKIFTAPITPLLIQCIHIGMLYQKALGENEYLEKLIV